jgi:hypothetical protein
MPPVETGGYRSAGDVPAAKAAGLVLGNVRGFRLARFRSCFLFDRFQPTLEAGPTRRDVFRDGREYVPARASLRPAPAGATELFLLFERRDYVRQRFAYIPGIIIFDHRRRRSVMV